MHDSWLDSIKTEIGKKPPALFVRLSEISKEDDDAGDFAKDMKPRILDCVKLTKTFLGEIRRTAPNYTLHDLTHSVNVIDLMGQLINNKNLSVFEVVLLIYSALLHDIGMVKLEGENISLDEIREDHGNRSAKFIKEEILLNSQNEPLSFGSHKDFFMRFLPQICASHMQDFIFVEKLPCDFRIDGINIDISLCAILLRLADAMDLKRNRAPYTLFNILKLKGISAEHWQKHLQITNCEIDENGHFRVDGICQDETMHRCLFNHFDLIEEELNKVFRWYIKNKITSPLSIKNNIILRHIDSQGYQLWSHSIQMDFPSISKLFMGEHLYGSKTVALRELIQNSIDACLVRKEISNDYSYEPRIDLHFDYDNDYLYIKDNGTGMTEDIIRKYFLNIGVSYYGSTDYSKLKLKYDPTGFFGIGFLSCFMLSDEVQVKTCSWNDSTERILHLHKEDRFVSMYTNNNSSFTGTEIRIDLKSVCQAFRTDKHSIFKEIKHYIGPLFWRLQFSEHNYDTLTSRINTISFQAYAKNQFSGYRKRDKINVSTYLDGVEGIILLQDLPSAKALWELNGVKYDKLLTALRDGEIILGNELETSIPFGKNSYLFDGESLVKIDSINIFHFTQEIEWALLLDDPNIDMKNIFSVGVPKEQYISIFSLVPLADYIHKNPQLYLGQGFHLYSLKSNALSSALKQSLSHGYKSIATSKCCSIPDQIIYTDAPTGIFYTDIDRVYLKQTAINFNSNYLNVLRCFGFYDDMVLLNITKKGIMPNTSRSNLLYEHQLELSKALEACLRLWLFDNLVDYPKAKKTCEYLWQSLGEILKVNNPFLNSIKLKYGNSNPRQSFSK